MPYFAMVTLAALILLNIDLRPVNLPEHLSGHRGTGDQWGAEFWSPFAGHKQDTVERDGFFTLEIVIMDSTSPW